MRITQLTRSLLFRSIVKKQRDHYTAGETSILICIYIMNSKGHRCSCNTLFKYMAEIHRTPYKKKFLSLIRSLIQEGMIRRYGRAGGTNLIITTAGRLYLHELEEKLRKLKIV